MKQYIGYFQLALVLSLLMMTINPRASYAESAPIVDNSNSTRALQGLPRTMGAKKIVTIYEFRSSVPEIAARGATDMFTNALVKSGAFAVAERSRLNEGVNLERQLAASGQTTGGAALGKLAGANYIFEGTISEANHAQEQSNGSINLGGMEVGASGNVDIIGIDVRVVDATNGLVVDSVNVSKSVQSSQRSVAGVGNMLGALAGLRGRSMPINIDVNVQSVRRESLDKAVRACIEGAVLELVKRYASE